MSILKKTSFSLSLALLLGLGNVNADVKMYSGNAPSAAEMGNILFSKKPTQMPGVQPSKMKMRSISFGKPKQAGLPEPTVASSQDSAIGLPIKFAYNSSEILDESKPFLMEIGKMLSLPDFLSEKLVIEGHTDAGGSEKYNRYLSERRAESVKKYLKDNYNIASSRLFITGMGESQPLADINPFAAVNRRVQFRKAP